MQLTFISHFRYLRSVVQNLQLIQHFKKQNTEHSPQRERLNFWMDIIVEATQGTTNGLRFPVLHMIVSSKNTHLHWPRLLLMHLSFLPMPRCWFWSPLKFTSHRMCPLTVKQKRRMCLYGTCLPLRRSVIHLTSGLLNSCVYYCLIFVNWLGDRREYTSGTSLRRPSKALGEIIYLYLSVFFGFSLLCIAIYYTPFSYATWCFAQIIWVTTVKEKSVKVFKKNWIHWGDFNWKKLYVINK